MNKHQQVFTKNLFVTLRDVRYQYVLINGNTYHHVSIIMGINMIRRGEDIKFMKDFLNSIIRTGYLRMTNDPSGEEFTLIKINTNGKYPGLMKNKPK